jgi:hypothetical protein
MDLNEFKSIINDVLLKKIKQSYGLAVFANKRSRFEGWLKVELVNILIQKGKNALPEVDRVDIVFDDILGIELKTINTNYNFDGKPITDNFNGKPITDNVNSIIKDINKLDNSNLKHKFIIFIVFPIHHNHKLWQKHLNKITKNKSEYYYSEFKFKNIASGVIYYLKV